MMHAPPLVLLTDDDPQIHDLYSTALKQNGFAVVEAWNGQEGLDLAMKEKPDFIILDVLMPVMDGPKTLLEIKENEKYKEIKNIPILILTSLEDRPVDVRVAKEIGAVDYMNKSVDLKTLVAKIKTTLNIK